jgi:hypothetical protein
MPPGCSIIRGSIFFCGWAIVKVAGAALPGGGSVAGFFVHPAKASTRIAVSRDAIAERETRPHRGDSPKATASVEA